MNSGNYKNAAETFGEVLKLDPENNAAKNNLAVAKTALNPSAKTADKA